MLSDTSPTTQGLSTSCGNWSLAAEGYLDDLDDDQDGRQQQVASKDTEPSLALSAQDGWGEVCQWRHTPIEFFCVSQGRNLPDFLLRGCAGVVRGGCGGCVSRLDRRR